MSHEWSGVRELQADSRQLAERYGEAMSSSADQVVAAIAARLHKDLFALTPDNFKQKSVYKTWNAVNREQVRRRALVRDTLRECEKCGLRIVSVHNLLTDDTIRYAQRLRDMGFTLAEEIRSILMTIRPLFPSLEIHSRAPKKCLEKRGKGIMLRR